jgi:hypothetical protein
LHSLTKYSIRNIKRPALSEIKPIATSRVAYAAHYGDNPTRQLLTMHLQGWVQQGLSPHLVTPLDTLLSSSLFPPILFYRS